jgi:hypothetical protein
MKKCHIRGSDTCSIAAIGSQNKMISVINEYRTVYNGDNTVILKDVNINDNILNFTFESQFGEVMKIEKSLEASIVIDEQGIYQEISVTSPDHYKAAKLNLPGYISFGCGNVILSTVPFISWSQRHSEDASMILDLLGENNNPRDIMEFIYENLRN